MAREVTIYRSTEEGERGRWFAVGHDPAAGLHGRDRTYYEPLTRYSRRRFWRAALHPWRYRLRVRLVRSFHGRREWQFTIARRALVRAPRNGGRLVVACALTCAVLAVVLDDWRWTLGLVPIVTIVHPLSILMGGD